MKPGYFLDFVASPLLVVLFLGLAWLQCLRPLRKQYFTWLRRCLRNLILSIPSHGVLRWAMLPLPLAAAAWAEQQHIGALNWIRLPISLTTVTAFLMMDYAYWWWHWANHRLGLFWRFHNVHHTDLDMDVSTATRFHFGEMIFSVGFLCLAVTAFGLSPMTFLLFFASFEAATLFHHSNWRLPVALERILANVFVTPRMHGIHHSIVERETNSNWGTLFSWWDRLHGTLRRDIPQDAITIGVAAYRDEMELTVGRLLALPFGKQRPWRLPNGETPERVPKRSMN